MMTLDQIPPAADISAVAGYLRHEVVAALTQERRRRSERMEPDLEATDEQRLAHSVLSKRLAVLRSTQAAAGMTLPDAEDDQRVRKLVLDGLFGLGPLQDLLDDPTVIEVNLIGCDQVWVTHDDGTKRAAAPVLPTDDDLVDWVRGQATYTGIASRPWDSANPVLECELPGGHRMVGLLGCSTRPVLSVRLLRRPDVTLAELQRLGTFDNTLGAFLAAAVRARLNIMVSGETGSGKTTLLRALAAEIPAAERIVTIEHFPELGLDRMPDRHPEVVALEERLPNAEGQGALTMTQLVRTSRRLSPDRLIVGECVGEEVVDMLDAMTQGNDGGFTTVHARSARKVPERIATYALRQGLTTSAALQLCATALDIVVHMAKVRLPGGGAQRLITMVDEVIGFDGQQVIMSNLWRADPGQMVAVPQAAMSDSLAERLGVEGFSRLQVAADSSWTGAVL